VSRRQDTPRKRRGSWGYGRLTLPGSTVGATALTVLFAAKVRAWWPG
jgi:hypothetical protein